ncbi:MAG: DUF2085 domain-containing protein [Gemmatimonadota bacterium]
MGETAVSRNRQGRPPIVRLGPGLRTPLALALGCHGNPDRCLKIGGWRMPVCARCVGIVAGNLAALPFFALKGLPGTGPILLGAALLLPGALDGGLQAGTRYRSANGRRILTGLAAGFGQALIAVGVLAALLGLPAG